MRRLKLYREMSLLFCDSAREGMMGESPFSCYGVTSSGRCLEWCWAARPGTQPLRLLTLILLSFCGFAVLKYYFFFVDACKHSAVQATGHLPAIAIPVLFSPLALRNMEGDGGKRKGKLLEKKLQFHANLLLVIL